MAIRNLLVLGAVNPGALENLYIDGFIKQGIQVERFDIYDRYITAINRSVFNKVINKISARIFYQAINRDLIRFISKKHFDAILVFKGMELYPETLIQLKKHARILANYNADHPFVYFFPGSGNENVLKGIPYYDVHFSYAASIVERLKKECNKTAYCIPFGYNGNLKPALSSGSSAYENHFVFIGVYDKKRAAYLDDLQNPMLQIYGDSKWRTRNIHRAYILKAFQNRALFGQDYVEAIKSSSGVINLLREQNLMENSHNMRTFEVPGSGGLLISQRTQEQQEYFTEDKEAVFFESMDELKSKLEFLSGKPMLVQSMKKAAFERSISSGYSYENRSRQLTGFLNQLD